MYMHMTWPSLFSMLRIFFCPTRLTYPNYHLDSKNFIELMEGTIQQASEAKTQRERSGHTRSIIDHLRREAPDDVADEEIKIEAFALLRAGSESQVFLSTGLG